MFKCIIKIMFGKKSKENDIRFTDCICKLKAIEDKLLNIKMEKDGN